MRTEPIIVGTVTLTQPKRFTQYSECAAWTDYVDCQPQTVELRWCDNYWLCATFQGVLGATTYPNRTIGSPDTGSVQWSYAGFDPEQLAERGYTVELIAGHVDDVGVYGPGTTHPGTPIRFFRLEPTTV